MTAGTTGLEPLPSVPTRRAPGPVLTTRALRRWLPLLAQRSPDLLTAYVLPGRVPPRVREAAMLGVTSVNRCAACQAVHDRWSRVVGLEIDRPAPDEAAAFAYGQEMAIAGPAGAVPPAHLPRRHRRELEAAALAMQLANLAGNRAVASRSARQARRLARRAASPTAGPGAAALQVGDPRTARLLDLVMRALDRAGVAGARWRIAGGARGDVLEIGIGSGLNFHVYPADATVHGIDASAAVLALAEDRARRLGRSPLLGTADAARLPYPDASFDTVVATFVLCSVDDVQGTLHEAHRVLRPGGTVRLLEHARSHLPLLAGAQRRLAPAWARASGGCRLDHDVRRAVRDAGLRVVEERRRAGGVLVEIVAAA